MKKYANSNNSKVPYAVRIFFKWFLIISGDALFLEEKCLWIQKRK